MKSLQGTRRLVALGGALVLALGLIVGFSMLKAYIKTAIAGKTAVSEVAGPKILANSGQLPLSFEPNQGQAGDARVKFLSRGPGYNLCLTPEEFVLSLFQPPSPGKEKDGQTRGDLKGTEEDRVPVQAMVP